MLTVNAILDEVVLYVALSAEVMTRQCIRNCIPQYQELHPAIDTRRHRSKRFDPSTGVA
jgi:hypothetical protein